MPPFTGPSGISPGVAQLIEILGSGFGVRRQEEEKRRVRADQDLQRDILLANLVKANAAETDIADAPQVPGLNHDVAAVAATGLPGQTPENVADAATAMGVSPETVPKRDVSITLANGNKIPLAPLKYKQEVDAEKIKDVEDQRLATGGAIRMTADMAEKLHPAVRGLFPVDSIVDKSIIASLIKPNKNYSFHNVPDAYGNQQMYATDSETGTATKVKLEGDAPKAGPDLTGEEFLKTLPPERQREIRSVTSFKLDPAKVTTLRGSAREKLIQDATTFDPSFDMTQYPTRQRIRIDFTSGKSADNIRSLNTVVSHLDRLNKTAKGLDNTKIKLWNKVKNWAKEESGDSTVTNFAKDASAVESELAKVFKGTGATDQEIKVWRENFSSAQSPKQLLDGIHEAIELMKGRLDALDDQWVKGMGHPRDFEILSKSSKRILDRLEQETGGIEPSDGGGMTMDEILAKHSLTPKKEN